MTKQVESGDGLQGPFWQGSVQVVSLQPRDGHIEAHRLRLAHSIDPYAALNSSRIDPLPPRHAFLDVFFARAETEAVGAQLVDLETLDADLRRALAGA